jgi:hypothetical protein
MVAEESYSPHSALVKMQLVVGHSIIRIKQMGGDFLIVEADRDYPPGLATIRMQVDTSERSWDVRLPEGISASSERVPLAVVE